MTDDSEDGYKPAGTETDKLRFNGYQFSDEQKCLSHQDGRQVRLRAQSLAVFLELAKAPDRVVSKDELINAVWPDVKVTDDSLTQCISDVRKALGDTDRVVLTTIPRQGYLLKSDEPQSTATKTSEYPSKPSTSAFSQPLFWLGVCAMCVLVAVFWKLTGDTPPDTPASQVAAASSVQTKVEPKGPTTHGSQSISGTPEIRLVMPLENDQPSLSLQTLHLELKSALNRYRSVSITEAGQADYDLVLNANSSQDRVLVELQNRSKQVIFAQAYAIEKGSDAQARIAKRVAAAIASPGVGAVGRELLQSSRLKPIASLSEAECFAHGFGCSKCSGEEDNITLRAEACLSHTLENNPDSARAWGLKATILAHQYWWGNTLPEPQRSNLSQRRGIPDQAITAANRAESLANGDDSAVYWGMAEAYYASCQVDKMQAAIERGLEINPDDPNLLAAFGNWLAYSGQWETGSAMIEKALAIEPRHYRKWWWMGLAKTHYFNEEFDAAYEKFLKSFNARNWVSHLQLAYTLPHLGRMDEAKNAVKNLQFLHPGITVEKALEHYRLLCFPNSFLNNMRQALELAGLPSLGNSQNLDRIVMPRAKLVELDDYAAEYVDHGTGEPVLFVHGSLSDYRSFGFYLAPISAHHRFIAYSRRYYGTQVWRDEGQRSTTAQQVTDLIEFIEALELGAVHAVSWSSGGSIVGHATVARPDLFKSAVYFEPFDAAMFNGQENDEQQLSDWNSRWLPVSEAFENNDMETAAQRFIEVVFETGDGGFETEREALQEIIRQNARSLYVENLEPDDTRWTFDCSAANKSTTPSLVVKGSLTHYNFTRLADLFSQCLSDAELAVIPGVNHRGPADDSEALSELVLDFVQKNL